MKTPFSSLFATWCLLAAPLVCPPAQAEDDPSPSPAPPLWLGDPGVDIDKARAHCRERIEAAMHLDIDLNLTAYEKVGRKDPRWDEAVRETLRNSSNFTPDIPGGSAAQKAQAAACGRAMAQGCNDPLIAYLRLRTGNYPPNTSPDELARLYTEAERNLAASEYPPLRKYYAAVRAVGQDMKCRRAAGGAVGEGGAGETKAAAGWAKGTDVKTACQHGLTQLETVLRDPSVPAALYYDVTVDFLEAASHDPIGRAEVFQPLEKLFTSGDAGKPLPPTANPFAGRFWIEDAWDARGDRGSYEMTPEQTKLFEQRMAKALQVLPEAWKLDPTEPLVTRDLIRASGDDSRDWDEIDRWFRRAMDAQPNDYKAAGRYLRYIQPNWGGSAGQMLDFARRCLATRDGASLIPLILLDVHTWLATHSDMPPEAYWRQPAVWAELHDMFELVLKARPDLTEHVTKYAICAARAGDWRVAQAQFERTEDILYPRALESLNCSPQQYRDLRREAADHAKAP